jgi:hypothetical protein
MDTGAGVCMESDAESVAAAARDTRTPQAIMTIKVLRKRE